LAPRLFVKMYFSYLKAIVLGSAISNGREPRKFLGRVFNIKLGSFVSKQLNCIVHTHSHF
jgi:hypothetical protein